MFLVYNIRAGNEQCGVESEVSKNQEKSTWIYLII